MTSCTATPTESTKPTAAAAAPSIHAVEFTHEIIGYNRRSGKTSGEQGFPPLALGIEQRAIVVRGLVPCDRDSLTGRDGNLEQRCERPWSRLDSP